MVYRGREEIEMEVKVEVELATDRGRDRDTDKDKDTVVSFFFCLPQSKAGKIFFHSQANGGSGFV